MQNRTDRKFDRRWLWILIPCLLILILQLAEWILSNRYQLELRTKYQIIKGVIIWFFAPLLMIVGFYQLYSDHRRRRMGGVLSSVLAVLLLCVVYARAGIYFYDQEYQKETWTEEGLLIGTDPDDFGKSVYKPVYGIFRTHFSGWEEGEMRSRLSGQYGSGVEIVRYQKGGSCICTADPERTGVLPFYFQVENDYWMDSNFESRLMAVNASVFWKTQNRLASLTAYAEEDPLELSDEIGGAAYASDDLRYLNVLCVSEEDIPACAADLADWYLYVKEDGRYFSNGQLPEDSCLKKVCLFGPRAFYVEFPELSRWMKNASWAELKENIEERLTENYPAASASDSSSEEDDSGEERMSDEEWAEWFLETYEEISHEKDSYEKECPVGDGTVRFRMVCVDAALGHRLYALLKSTDSGNSWQVQSRDPFAGQMGMGIDFTFLTEEYGFASLAHNGGDEAELYVTEDGGKSYERSVFQGVGAELEDGYRYNPYDFPQMPFEENGRLYVLCGQGEDGDYAGGDAAGMALFESEDRGHTFLYREIQKPE